MKDFSNENLINKDYSNQNLIGCSIINKMAIGTNFENANLKGANLSGSIFRNANMKGVNLTNANLTGAVFIGCDLTGAYLSHVRIENTVGNMKEIKSAQFDRYMITWIREPNGTNMVQFNCQCRDGEKWKKTTRLINKLDKEGYDWFVRNRDMMIQLVENFPAIEHAGSK